VEVAPERRYAEEAGVVLAGMGLPPAYGKLLGWLLICDPPRQTSAELAEALNLSKGSVSAGMRMLEKSGLARRVPIPGRRGHAYEMSPEAIIRIAADPTQFRRFRELMEHGLQVIGGEEGPRARRLRITRDFYAFIERELPKLTERFIRDYLDKEANTDG
jgi:DNA-binding Lrp family transcriptional regulator